MKAGGHVFVFHAAPEGPWQLCTEILLEKGEVKVMGKEGRDWGGGVIA